jgi:MEMO1 family protein
VSAAAAPEVRPAAVAGLFYPDDPDELASTVDGLLAAAEHAPEGPPPRAIVVPHAGYAYSGPIAATAYRRLLPHRELLRRVVLLGPAHRSAFRGLVAPRADGFATPLGEVPVDRRGRDRIADLTSVTVDDGPHAEEHSLEVQLPFLQRVLGDDWSVLPLVVGQASAREVADVLEVFWEDPPPSERDDGTVIVVSTDLSHYHRHATAQQIDRDTAAAIVARDVEALGAAEACGAFPLRGLLELARRHDLHLDLLDLRTSGDTAGDTSRVVGYGAFAVR